MTIRSDTAFLSNTVSTYFVSLEPANASLRSLSDLQSVTAIDRVVHHSMILDFDVPSFRTEAAQQRGQDKEVHRQR